MSSIICRSSLLLNVQALEAAFMGVRRDCSHVHLRRSAYASIDIVSFPCLRSASCYQDCIPTERKVFLSQEQLSKKCRQPIWERNADY